MSEIFIQTREKLIDYEFLVKFPNNSWWRYYRELTSFEYPTIIIENINNHPRVYLSAIPSKRKDRVQTTIRYTIVIEIQENDPDIDYVIKLVNIWLNEVRENPKNHPIQSQIGNLLDKEFDENFVKEALISKQGKIKVEEKLRAFISEIKNFNINTKQDETKVKKIWFGGIRNENSREDWISLVKQLLNTKVKGAALLLNLAEGSDLEQLSKDLSNNIPQKEKFRLGLLIDNDNQPKEFSQKRNIPIVVSLLILCVSLGLVNSNFFQSNSLNAKENNAIQLVSKSCPKATSIQPKPENKLTLEQLANQLGVSVDDILSQTSKCNDEFKKWSATYGKGIWDFEIDNSESNKPIFKFKEFKKQSQTENKAISQEKSLDKPQSSEDLKKSPETVEQITPNSEIKTLENQESLLNSPQEEVN